MYLTCKGKHLNQSFITIWEGKYFQKSIVHLNVYATTTVIIVSSSGFIETYYRNYCKESIPHFSIFKNFSLLLVGILDFFRIVSEIIISVCSFQFLQYSIISVNETCSSVIMSSNISLLLKVLIACDSLPYDNVS